MNKPEYVYVGSWKSPKKDDGGLKVLRRSSDESIECVFAGYPELSAGNFAISRDRKFLYAAHEVKGDTSAEDPSGRIYAFAIQEATGIPILINTVSSVGVFPNSLTVDATGRFLIAVNYGSEDTIVRSERGDDGRYRLRRYCDEGSIAVFPLKNGALCEASEIITHSDPPSQKYLRTQSSSHPHSVNISPDNKMLVVCDRGCDLVVAYRFDEQCGKLTRSDECFIEGGLGPRNSVFHPGLPYFYVVHELYPYITAFSYDAERGKIFKLETIPVVKDMGSTDLIHNFMQIPHPADIRIHPDGHIIAVSVRSADKISLLKIDFQTGKLLPLSEADCKGHCPRSCCWSKNGKYLYVCNQNDGSVDLFAFHMETASLVHEQKISGFSTPVCLRV